MPTTPSIRFHVDIAPSSRLESRLLWSEGNTLAVALGVWIGIVIAAALTVWLTVDTWRNTGEADLNEEGRARADS